MRAFPVIYANDVDATAAFYVRLGWVEQFRMPSPDGTAGYVGLVRDGVDLAVTTVETPRTFIGVEPGGGGPRFELYVFVDDLDATVADLRDAGVDIVREPADMPWGERVAIVTDPEGNPVVLAVEPA
jgi:lactoylglutathione lyase